MIGWARVFALIGANEGPVFDPGHIRRIRPGQIRIRTLGRVQATQCPGLDHLIAEQLILALRAIAPEDGLGLREFSDLSDPIRQALMVHPLRGCPCVGGALGGRALGDT